MVLEILEKFETKEDKHYGLNAGFDSFFQTYPFMCLVKTEFDKLKEEGKSEKEREKLLLYPYSKFPAEIIVNKLFLGDIYASNSQKHLEDLKIKTLVDFISYKEEEIVPAFKEEKYQYLHFPIDKDVPVNLDFDIICAEIDSKIQEGRTLFYCRDGESISSAFAIAYLMYKVGLDINMATLKVCQAISRTDVNKWMYTQLLVYKPKK